MIQFIWRPDLGAERDETPNVTATKFGDGYESRLASGLNPLGSKWAVEFTKGLKEYKQIRAFLKEAGAVKSFLWEDPEGEQGIYVCRSWKSRQVEFGVYLITGTFEQVFE